MKIRELASLLNGTVVGDGDPVITGIRAIDEAGEGDLTFLANPQYRHLLKNTGAGAVQGDDAEMIEGAGWHATDYIADCDGIQARGEGIGGCEISIVRGQAILTVT